MQTSLQCVQCDAGAGEVDWHSLSTVFSSEMLKFEEEQRVLDEAAKAQAAEGSHTPPSRRGSGPLDQLPSPRGQSQVFLCCIPQFATLVPSRNVGFRKLKQHVSVLGQLQPDLLMVDDHDDQHDRS